MEYCLPDYSGHCVDNLRELSGFGDKSPSRIRVVLFVVDGLGYEALRSRPTVAPTLNGHLVASITSVAPTTTAAALTSITTASAPGVHGIVGQCLPVPDDAGGWFEFDVLRWRWTRPAVGAFQPGRVPAVPFGGERPYVISKRKHLGSGFTTLHLGRDPDGVWKMPSAIPVEVAHALRSCDRDVYVYYDGLDTTAHHHGFGAHYDAELGYVDFLVSRLVELLPPGTRLVVTSDHGCVEISEYRALPADVIERAALVGGEDRNMYLIARPGDAKGLAADVTLALRDVAWVFTTEEALDLDLFGSVVDTAARTRVGDVRVFPYAGYGLRPTPDAGWQPEVGVCGHGSLTAQEMFVPLVVAERP